MANPDFLDFKTGRIEAYKPSSNIVACWGDSRLSATRAQGLPTWTGGAADVDFRLARGIQNWVESLTFGAIECPLELVYAVNGHDMSEQLNGTVEDPLTMDEEITAATAAGAGIGMYLCGVNGTRTQDPDYKLQADCQLVYEKLKATGWPIFIINDWPVMAPTGQGYDPECTVTQWRRHLMIRDFWNQKGRWDPQFIVLDMWPHFGPTGGEPAIPTGTQLLYYEDEYLHQNMAGSNLIAKLMMPYLNEWFPTPPALTAGTETVSYTGAITATSPDGITSTPSTASRDFGAPFGTVSGQECTFSGTATNANSFTRVWEQSWSAAEGSQWRVEALYFVSKDQPGEDFGLQFVDLGVLAGFGGPGATYDMSWHGASENYPVDGAIGKFSTPTLTIPSGQTAVRLRFRAGFKQGQAANALVGVYDVRLIQVA